MSFPTPGTNVPIRIVFNQGTIDFGNSRLVEVDNLSFGLEFSTMYLYVLGSIKGQDLVRHSEKVTLTGKIKSYSPEMDNLAYGSSIIGTPQEITVLDGQATLQNPVVTIFDRNGKEIVYQFLNATFKSSKVNLKAEDYAEFDFELDALDINELYTA